MPSSAEHHVERHYEVRLRASAERASQAGRIVAAHLRHWNLAPHMLPVGEAVAELVTNVQRHVGDQVPCTVELHLGGRHLTASVHDEGARMPHLLPAGGGLAWIAALSDSWGSCPVEGGGKVVWFTRGIQVDLPELTVAVSPAGALPAPKPAGATDGDGAGERVAAVA